MLVKLGRWEIRSRPANQARDGQPPKRQTVRISRTITFGERDLDEAVGDFITRHVLERDSELFDG